MSHNIYIHEYSDSWNWDNANFKDMTDFFSAKVENTKRKEKKKHVCKKNDAVISEGV